MRNYNVTVKALPIWGGEQTETLTTIQQGSDFIGAIGKGLRAFKKEKKQVRHQKGRRYVVEAEQI